MTAPVITFFNNKGGVGKTSLVYHIAWMMSLQGRIVVAADLDPQANLTANFLDEDQLERIWSPAGTEKASRTVYEHVAPLIKGTGDIADPTLVGIGEPDQFELNSRIFVFPGDLSLSLFEDDLSSQWPDCLDGKERAFRVISAFWRLLSKAGARVNADIILVDVGPNLGAINRAALIAADHVVIPLAPDLFSVQGLQNLGPRLREWREAWSARLSHRPELELALPEGRMQPAGYVLLGHGVRLGRAVQAYQRWMDRIPGVYRKAVLDVAEPAPDVSGDPYCLAQIKHYRSLLPLSYEARKPVFALKPADGAFGGHQAAVSAARADFEALTKRILGEIATQ